MPQKLWKPLAKSAWNHWARCNEGKVGSFLSKQPIPLDGKIPISLVVRTIQCIWLYMYLYLCKLRCSPRKNTQLIGILMDRYRYIMIHTTDWESKLRTRLKSPKNSHLRVSDDISLTNPRSHALQATPSPRKVVSPAFVPDKNEANDAAETWSLKP